MTLFKDKKWRVVFEELRAIDRSRILQKLGVLEKEAQSNILNILAILFQK